MLHDDEIEFPSKDEMELAIKERKKWDDEIKKCEEESKDSEPLEDSQEILF